MQGAPGSGPRSTRGGARRLPRPPRDPQLPTHGNRTVRCMRRSFQRERPHPYHVPAREPPMSLLSDSVTGGRTIGTRLTTGRIGGSGWKRRHHLLGLRCVSPGVTGTGPRTGGQRDRLVSWRLRGHGKLAERLGARDTPYLVVLVEWLIGQEGDAPMASAQRSASIRGRVQAAGALQ